MRRVAFRSIWSLAGVTAITFAAHAVVPVNPTTAGFAYLLFVLLIASTWGYVEALLASLAATLSFNFFFLPPVGTLTIADPQNWVALFSFLATALIASRLSAKAEQRAREAVERQRDLERLYSFSRAILLIGDAEPFPKQLLHQLAEIFELDAALLFDRRTGDIYRAGPRDFEGLDDQLRDAALRGSVYADADHKRVITAVRLGSEPIGSIALEGARMPDSVLQGIANLIAIGLERARAQDLAHQVEVARQSEQLRTTLIDAMAHGLKTPLTSIKAVTTSLLADLGQPIESRKELLTVADEEANHLREIIDDSLEMARLDTTHIDVHLEPSQLGELVAELVVSMQAELAERPVAFECAHELPSVPLDRRLAKLAIKQLLDNALKYSPSGTPLDIQAQAADGFVAIAITDRGPGLPSHEQKRIFERFYRSPSVSQIPGFGLGLSIANGIAKAHGGELTVESMPGRTTFRMTFPMAAKEVPA